ncbi:unnamed protein product [Spirodela intermedia]|uniref:Uncharacterized protein n=1 Tax=Spirodela intermedia TaxID=51605 RepID=A0A7I8II00_SPIIN|nr:unnamed protein product [Spirodela intermedia]CAA6657346.1 unnamed protein product [Spirodela intermedia]
MRESWSELDCSDKIEPRAAGRRRSPSAAGPAGEILVRAAPPR